MPYSNITSSRQQVKKNLELESRLRCQFFLSCRVVQNDAAQRVGNLTYKNHAKLT